MKDKIVNSTLINIVNLAFGFILSFALTPLILRRLGTDQYGIWVFLSIFSASGYFSLLDLGMQGSAVKYVAEYHARGEKEKLNHLVNSVVFFFLAMGVIAGVILLLINGLFLDKWFNVPLQYLPAVRVLVNLIALSFLFQFPLMGFSAVVEGLKRYDILRGTTIVTSIVNALLIYCLLTYANGLWLMVGASLAMSLLTALCYLGAAVRLLPEYTLNPFAFQFGILKQLFNMGGKLIVSRIVGLIFNNTQKILIAAFLTMAVMTNFDIINKVHMIVLTIMSLMNQALIPFASHLDAAGDEERLRLLFVKATKYAVLLTLPALIFFMALAGEFLGIWIGPEFAAYALLTQFYLSHCLLTVLTGVGSTMMVGMNRVRELLNISVLGAVLNLLITLLTIRQWGIGGLVAGTVLAYVICQIIFIGLFAKLFKIGLAGFLRQVVLGPYLLAGSFFLLTILFKQWFAFTSLGQLFFFAVFLYAAYLSVYLLIDRQERALLWGLAWKR